MDPHMFSGVPKILLVLGITIAVVALGAGVVVHLLLKI